MSARNLFSNRFGKSGSNYNRKTIRERFGSIMGDVMKRASLIAAVLLVSAASFAQIRGVPASVTSTTFGRSMSPGVPASVTSLGPNGYSTAPCTQPGCGNAYFFYPIGTTPATIAQPAHTGHHGGGNGGHHHHGNGGSYGGGYVYVPYAYPVPVAVESDEPEPEEPEPPAPTIYERRPVVQPQPQRYIERQPVSNESAETEAPHHNMSPVSDEKIPVVVVYKDGHQQEIGNGNYAIVGEMLYDLSGPIAKKIKLADLDLSETVKLNEQRGVEFSLPAAFKPQV